MVCLRCDIKYTVRVAACDAENVRGCGSGIYRESIVRRECERSSPVVHEQTSSRPFKDWAVRNRRIRDILDCQCQRIRLTLHLQPSNSTSWGQSQLTCRCGACWRRGCKSDRKVLKTDTRTL